MPEATLKDFGENNPVQMQQAIAHLLAGRTVPQVAELVGIPRGRISRWYRDSEEFQRLLGETEQVAIDAIRREVRDEAARDLDELLPRAREVLGTSLESDKDTVALSAARAVYQLAGVGAKQNNANPRPMSGLIRNRKEDVGPVAGD